VDIVYYVDYKSGIIYEVDNSVPSVVSYMYYQETDSIKVTPIPSVAIDPNWESFEEIKTAFWKLRDYQKKAVASAHKEYNAWKSHKINENKPQVWSSWIVEVEGLGECGDIITIIEYEKAHEFSEFGVPKKRYEIGPSTTGHYAVHSTQYRDKEPEVEIMSQVYYSLRSAIDEALREVHKYKKRFEEFEDLILEFRDRVSD
jgi:hypothetical protein